MNCLSGPDPMNADKMVEWSVAALDFFKDYHKNNQVDGGYLCSLSFKSLKYCEGRWCISIFIMVYLRAVDNDGKKILHDVDYQEYDKYIEEEVKTWSYMKFPYLKEFGPEKGWYRVGPLPV